MMDNQITTNDDEKIASNVDKTFLQLRIAETIKRIERLENRNDELFNRNAETTRLIAKIDVETKDRIADLNREISVETLKISETMSKIMMVEKLRGEEKQNHQKFVEEANKNYEKTHLKLVSSIKLLNSRINTLANYKENRIALAEKLKIRDDLVNVREQQVVEKLSEIHQKSKIDKEKSKNDIYNRVIELGVEFLREQIAKTSDGAAKIRQRLQRENIFIVNELTEICKDILAKSGDSEEFKFMKHALNFSRRRNDRLTTERLASVEIMRSLVKLLREIDEKLLKKLAKPREINWQNNYDVLDETVKRQLSISATRTRHLQVLLHRELVRTERKRFEKNREDSRLQILRKIISDVKNAIVELLAKSSKNRENMLYKNKDSQVEETSRLLRFIVDGLSRMESSKALVFSSKESICRPEDVYAKGDLDFEPKRLNYDYSRFGRNIESSRVVKPLEMFVVDSPTIPTNVIAAAMNQRDESDDNSTNRSEIVSSGSTSVSQRSKETLNAENTSESTTNPQTLRSNEFLESNVQNFEKFLI